MARKRLKMGKKALCLIFAFLLTIESFGAVVTDNDGSAFISKAEYDSLTIDLQNQITEKNKNLDNLIDLAISGYVLGTKNIKKKYATNLVKQAEDVMGKQILWSNATSIDADTCANRSVYEVEMICARSSRNRVGLWTIGYDIDSNVNFYRDGYNVLKATSRGVMYRTCYRPLQRFFVSYFAYGNTGDYGSDLSSWSSLLGTEQSQFDTLSKSWIGFMNNTQAGAPVVYDASTNTYSVQRDATHEAAWRSVSRVYFPSENKLDFKMLPYCNSVVSVWYSDNTEMTSGLPGGFCRSTQAVYTSSIVGGTNPSSVPYSSVNHPLYSIAGWNGVLAWVKKDRKYNEQVLDLNGQSVYPCAMKYGLPLVHAEYKGKLKYTLSIKPGDFAIYKGTPKIFGDVTSNKRSVTTVTAVSDEISVDIGDTVFVIYAPSTESRLVFDELYYEVE